jgi:polar amino acid transport system substrate-binding protein
MRLRATSITVAGLVAALAWLPARAEIDAATKPGCSRPVTVAASSVGRSMIVTPDGAVSGLIPDFMKQVAALSGCTIQFQVVPRARAFLMLEAGTVDLVTSANQTPQRDKWGVFVQMYSTRPMLMALNPAVTKLTTTDELVASRVTLGVVRGYDYGSAYTQLLGLPALEGRISTVTDPDTVARMLAAGRVDAALMTPAAFVNAAETANLEDRVLVVPLKGLPASAAGMYLARASLSAQDSKKIAAAVATLVARGTYGRLLKQYYAKPAWALQGIDTVVPEHPPATR